MLRSDARPMPELILFIGVLVLLLLGAFREQDAAQLLPPLAVLPCSWRPWSRVAHDQHARARLRRPFRARRLCGVPQGADPARCRRRRCCSPAAFLQDERIERYEYPLLALFSTLGMCMMVSANSFLALYMALELQSLPIYVLAAFHRDNLRSTEAGLKYFVLGALASGMLLYGCSLVYGFTGTIQFDALAAALACDRRRPLPLGCPGRAGVRRRRPRLQDGGGAVPHVDARRLRGRAVAGDRVHGGGTQGGGRSGLAMRVLMGPFGAWAAQWQQIVIAVSIASMALGAFAAIGQTNIKRLMAYSGIANVGFALVGVAAGTTAGVNGTLVYMAIYLVMTLGTFACILLMRREGRYVETIADLAGLSRGRPMMALALAILMFSLAGIPPLAGFIGKLYVFRAAIDAGLTLVRRDRRRAVGRRRLLLSADRQADVFRRAGRGVRPRRRYGRSASWPGSAPRCCCSSCVPFMASPVLPSRPRRPPRPWHGDRRAARARLPPAGARCRRAAPTTSRATSPTRASPRACSSGPREQTAGRGRHGPQLAVAARQPLRLPAPAARPAYGRGRQPVAGGGPGAGRGGRSSCRRAPSSRG